MTDHAPNAAETDGPARLTTAGRPVKILFLVTEDWYFWSHRLPVARAAKRAGADVTVATRVGKHGPRIEAEGFTLIDLPWRRRTRNPFAEIRTLVRLVGIYRRARPDVAHHVALKPTIYGGMVALIARTRCTISAVAGLGYVSTSAQLRARLLRPVFRFVFRAVVNRAGSYLIVQNPDDAAALVEAGLFDAPRIHLVRGSGVDGRRFSATSEPSGAITAALVGRMLRSKGIEELVAAARMLRDRGDAMRVLLVGNPDRENPESLTEERLRRWESEGVIEWLGHVDDVASLWRQTHIAVLPSYREGLPKALLEAAACARPMIATDVPGCREVVRDGDTGLLVPLGDIGALADALARLKHDAMLRKQLGARAREHVVESFTESTVVRETLALYREVCPA